MNRHYRITVYIILATGVWLLAPHVAFADNCSSLNDCYYTLRAALAAAVGLGVFAALMAIGLDIGPLSRGIRRKFKSAPGPEGAGASEADVWERSLGIVSVAGMVADKPRTAGAQQSLASAQGSPPGASPAAEARMSQALERTVAGDTGRTPAEPLHGDRTVDQTRSREGDVLTDHGEEAGRHGDWSGQRGTGAAELTDSGDVLDRAQDVAEALGKTDAEGMAQAGEPMEEPSQPASAQSAPPEQTPAKEMPSQASEPREAPQDRAKSASLQATPESTSELSTGSSQGNPPPEPGVVDAGEVALDSGATGQANTSAPPPSAELARQLLRTYRDLARVPGASLLLQQVGLNGHWAARSAAAQLGIARSLAQQGNTLMRMADVTEERGGADILLENGIVLEVKSYYWAGPFFQDEDNVTDATRRLVRQLELLRRRYAGRDVQVAFSDLRHAPRQMVHVLQSIGVHLVPLADSVSTRPEDVVDGTYLERLRAMTADTYLDNVLAICGNEADKRLEARIASAFRQDAGSAWLALAVCAFDAESIYETNPLGESYAAHLRLLSNASEGALQASNVIERVAGRTLEVVFENAGRQYVSRVSAESDIFDYRVLDAINAAVAEGGEQRRFVPLPAPDQMLYLTFVSEESQRRLQEAGLVPPIWPIKRQT